MAGFPYAVRTEGGRGIVDEVLSPTITVAVLTYRRPHHLTELLPMVLEQGDDLLRVPAVAAGVEVIVVDNDPRASARSTVEAIVGRIPGTGTSLRYVHEPRPGIAAGRNRALDESVGRDLLVFIDDDERPFPDWLGALVRSHAEHRSAAVVGAVVAQYDGDLDPWIEAGGFFVRRRHPTGTIVPVAAAGNLLLDRAFIRQHALRFDEQVALAGGEDTLFTRRITSLGGRMVWCDESVIVDLVPVERMSRRWVVRRSLSSGNAWSATALLAENSTGTRTVLRLRLMGQGAARAVGGSARWLGGQATRSTRHQARGARTAARGAGMVLGGIGYRYQEYRREPAASGSS